MPKKKTKKDYSTDITSSRTSYPAYMKFAVYALVFALVAGVLVTAFGSGSI